MDNNHTKTIGYWSALLSVIFAIGYSVPQILSAVKIIPHPQDLFWLFLPSLFLAPVFFNYYGLLMPVLVLAFFFSVFYYVGAVWMITFPLSMINAAKLFHKVHPVKT